MESGSEKTMNVVHDLILDHCTAVCVLFLEAMTTFSSVPHYRRTAVENSKLLAVHF